jgi:hypothetical protein
MGGVYGDLINPVFGTTPGVILGLELSPLDCLSVKMILPGLQEKDEGRAPPRRAFHR